MVSQCHKCNTVLKSTDKFCYKCGEKIVHTEVIVQHEKRVEESLKQILYYAGRKYTFELGGEFFCVSEELDMFNYYRREYKKLATEQADAFKEELVSTIHSLDEFLQRFYEIYIKYRQRMIDVSMEILYQAGVYDISKEIFTGMHEQNYHLCADDITGMIENFNQTIRMNQEKKIRMYNMIPGIIFGGGVVSVLAAAATNIAVTSIAAHDIKNANVTQSQRWEMFRRIDPHYLANRAYLDYWKTHMTLMWSMGNRGIRVWYPTQEMEVRAEGIYQNLCADRIPREKVNESIANVLGLNPYNEEYHQYIVQKFGKTEPILNICKYFGFYYNVMKLNE